MAITVRNLITAALVSADAIAIGESPSEAEIFKGLSKFNDRVALLSLDNLWSYSITRYDESTIGSQAKYSVGNTTLVEDFQMPRPPEIVALNINIANVWYPLQQVSPIEWDNRTKLADNISSSIPTYFTYRPDYPSSEIELYPTPDSSYQLKIAVREMKTEYILDDELELPVGYQGYLEYALSSILAIEFGSDPNLIAQLSAIASNRLATIKRQNTNPRELKLNFLPSRNRDNYDVRSDTFLNGGI